MALRKRFLICLSASLLFVVAINACGTQAKVANGGGEDGELIIPPSDKEKMRDNVSLIVGRDTVYYVQNDTTGLHEHPHEHGDTTNILAKDTTLLGGSHTDSLRRRGSLEANIISTAKDSIVEDFSGGKRVLHYYGDVNVKYGESLEIKSAYMRYDMDSKIVYASGMPDSTKTIQGKPEMQEGENKFTMDELYHNFESGKSIIKHIITQESEGYLHGDLIKKMPDNSFNLKDGKYTTCDHEHPHFYLRVSMAKRTDDSRMIFGPSTFVLEDVPIYPLTLPFGFVPKNTKRSGGLMMPSFNEEVARGFSIKDFGYYFVISDHFDVTLTGDFFTMGSWNAKVTSRYKKRYKFDGNLEANYSLYKIGDKDDPANYSESTEFGFSWSHSQDSKARPGTTFRASVNFSSPKNNRYNANNINDMVQNQMGSSISYGKVFDDSPFSLSLNIRHNQNSIDSSYAVTLPNITFTMNRIYPFRSKDGVGNSKFLDDISFSYNTVFENNVKFKASDFGKDDFMSKFRNGMSHRFDIGLPSFSLMKYLQFSPGINYGMNWFFQKNDISYDDVEKEIKKNITAIFSHFGATHTFGATISVGTTIYGMYNFTNSRLIKIRHMMKPRIDFSFTPDMNKSWNGFRMLEYQYDHKGTKRDTTYNYNIYDGLINASGKVPKSAAMSFSLTNNVEAKIRSKNDTTVNKVKLIDNLSLNGSYNFLADSMKLSNILVSMTTTVFGSLALNLNGTFNPYGIDENGYNIAKLYISQKGGLNLARLMNASASFSYQFSGSGGNGRKKGGSSGGNSGMRNSGVGNPGGGSSEEGHSSSEYVRIYENPLTGEYIPGGWVYYLDPNNPWSINFNYSYSYSRSYSTVGGKLKPVHNHNQTLGLSGQIRLGPSMNFNLQSNLDISKMKISTTQLSATYDLHDFLISVTWIPMGTMQSWGFRINAKAASLADLLKFRKNASYWDNNNFR